MVVIVEYLEFVRHGFSEQYRTGAAEPIRDIVRKPCAANTGVRFCRTARYALFIWMFVYEFLYSDGVMCV